MKTLDLQTARLTIFHCYREQWVVMISPPVEVKHFSQVQMKMHIKPYKCYKRILNSGLWDLYSIHIQIQIPLLNYWQYFSIKIKMVKTYLLLSETLWKGSHLLKNFNEPFY